MSVLSRRHTVPAQRSAAPRDAVDTALPLPRPEAKDRVVPPAPTSRPARRRAALIASAAVLAVGAGTAVYVVADGGSPEPAAPAAPAPGFEPALEGQRAATLARRDASLARSDAALARRGPATPADATRTTEALRDAATAARGGSQAGTGQAGQSATNQSGTGLIP